MEGLEQRLDGASWETGRLLLESPIGRELSDFQASTQCIISRARLRIFHAIPRVCVLGAIIRAKRTLTGKANAVNLARVAPNVVSKAYPQRMLVYPEVFSWSREDGAAPATAQARVSLFPHAKCEIPIYFVGVS